MEARDEELAADDAVAGDGFFAFGDDGLPVGSLAAGCGFDDPRVGGLIVRHQKEAVLGVDDPDMGFDVVDERDKVTVRLAQVLHEEVFAGGGDAVGDVDDEEVVVVGDADTDQIELAELLATIFAAKELRVVGDGRAEFVEPDVGALVSEFRVVEAAVVGAEADARVARGGQDVRQIGAGAHIKDVHGAFVGAAFANFVDKQVAVVGDVDHIGGGVLVGAEFGGVDQALIVTVPADAHVDRSLVLVGEALLEEILSGAHRWRGVLVDAHEGGQLAGDLRQGRDLGEVFLRVGILLADPGARGGTLRILEPTVGVFDLRAVVVVGDDVDGGDGGRRQRDAVVARLRGAAGILGCDHQCTGKEDEGGNEKGSRKAASRGHAGFLIG